MSSPTSQHRPKRALLRDLLTVLTGTAGAQMLGILVLPLLARSFAVEAFGVFQVYFSVLVFLSVGVSLRMEIALLSKPESEIEAYTQHLLGLAAVVSLTATFVLLAFDILAEPIGFPVALLGVGLFGTSVTQIISYRLIRRQLFRQLATLKVTQVAIYAVIAVAIALVQPTLWGLVLADVAGRLGAALLALELGRKTLGGARFAFRGMKSFVASNRQLGLVSLPGAMANSAGAMITPLMIFQVFGAAAAGQYGLVDRSLGAPVAMLVMAGSQVFSGRMADQVQHGDLKGARQNFRRTAATGLAISFIGSAACYAAIPIIFPLVFGSGWDLAQEIAQILVFAFGIILISGIVNQTLVILSAYRMQAAWDFCRPMALASLWMIVIALDLDVKVAVGLHAAVSATFGMAFLTASYAKLNSMALKIESHGR